MSQVGIVLDVPTIKRLRAHFRELSGNLEKSLQATENSIEEVARTWQDENFKNFKSKFDQDKVKLRPLGRKVAEFEDCYLKEIERRLMNYINRR